MKKFLIMIFVVLAQVCAGQPSITWQRVYEGPYNGDDGFHGIVGDNFGNSYLLGYVSLQSTTGFFVVKIDSHGDTIWTKNIGGYGNGQGAYSGSVTTDGGIVFTGANDTAFTIRLSANGDILWNKKYHLPTSFQYAILSDMIKTSDKGYLMCGKVFTQTKGLIIKIDSSGNLQWYKIHSAPFQKRYNKVIEVDSGYLIDGEADISAANTYTVLLKINYEGDTIWERQFQLFASGFYPSTIFWIRNSYWIFGNSRGLKFVKFDTAGIIIDSVSIYSPLNRYDLFRDAIKVNNNNFVVTSFSAGFSVADTNYAEVKIIDSLGIIHQSKLFLGYQYTQLTSSKVETNGDLTFGGLMYYWQRGTNSNGYAVRTDSNLNYPPVSINNNEKIIKKDYALYQNYPNPFNPETIISFEVPERSSIQILIYDTKGDLISNLINKHFNAGRYSIKWNGTNFSTGNYFVNLIINGNPTRSIKAILLK